MMAAPLPPRSLAAWRVEALASCFGGRWWLPSTVLASLLLAKKLLKLMNMVFSMMTFAQSQWLVRNHGLFEVLGQDLGLSSKHQTCHHEVWIHLSYVIASSVEQSREPRHRKRDFSRQPAKKSRSWNPYEKMRPFVRSWSRKTQLEMSCVTRSFLSEHNEFSRLAFGRISCTGRAFFDESMFCVSCFTCSHQSLLHCD